MNNDFLLSISDQLVLPIKYDLHFKKEDHEKHSIPCLSISGLGIIPNLMYWIPEVDGDDNAFHKPHLVVIFLSKYSFVSTYLYIERVIWENNNIIKHPDPNSHPFLENGHDQDCQNNLF